MLLTTADMRAATPVPSAVSRFAVGTEKIGQTTGWGSSFLQYFDTLGLVTKDIWVATNRKSVPFTRAKFFSKKQLNESKHH